MPVSSAHRPLPLLDVRDVGVQFRAVRAVDRVSLRVSDGSVVGLVGPNGAGKTTLFNAISGFVRPASGEIRFQGRRITGWPSDRRARAGLGRTFQNVGLNKRVSVLENLRCAADARRLALVAGRPERLTAPRQHHRDDGGDPVDEVCELLGLSPILGHPVADLPIGWAKIAELGCVLVRRPRLIMLDEPSAGLGPDETLRMAAALTQVRRTRPVAMLMIEHDMSLIRRTVDYLYVLNFGLLLAEGVPEHVMARPEVVEAYLGREG
ncbi:MAG: hypothetical protein QOI86_2608, partial [Actinomycetota bacterium]|nr:hypothetical protein [Actinomycetota bacterium]